MPGPSWSQVGKLVREKEQAEQDEKLLRLLLDDGPMPPPGEDRPVESLGLGPLENLIPQGLAAKGALALPFVAAPWVNVGRFSRWTLPDVKAPGRLRYRVSEAMGRPYGGISQSKRGSRRIMDREEARHGTDSLPWNVDTQAWKDHNPPPDLLELIQRAEEAGKLQADVYKNAATPFEEKRMADELVEDFLKQLEERYKK